MTVTASAAARHHHHVEKFLREDEHVKLLLQIGAKETNAALRAIYDSTVIDPMRQWFRSLPLRGCWYEALVTEEEITSVVERIKYAITTGIASISYRTFAIRKYLLNCRKAIQFVVDSSRSLKAKKAQIVRSWSNAQLSKRNEVKAHVRQLTVLHRSATNAKVIEASELGFELFLDDASMLEIVDYVWIRRRDLYLKRLREARADQARLLGQRTVTTTSKVAIDRMWKMMLRGYPLLNFDAETVTLRELCLTLVALQHAKLLDSINHFEVDANAARVSKGGSGAQQPPQAAAGGKLSDEAQATTTTNGGGTSIGPPRTSFARVIETFPATASLGVTAAANDVDALPVSFYYALLTQGPFRTELPLFVTLKELQRNEELTLMASTDPHDQRSVKQAIKIHNSWRAGRGRATSGAAAVPGTAPGHRPSSPMRKTAHTQPTPGLPSFSHPQQPQQKTPKTSPVRLREVVSCSPAVPTVPVAAAAKSATPGGMPGRHVHVDMVVVPLMPASPAPQTVRGRPASARMHRYPSPPRQPSPLRLAEVEAEEEEVWSAALKFHKAACTKFRRRHTALSSKLPAFQQSQQQYSRAAAPPASAAAASSRPLSAKIAGDGSRRPASVAAAAAGDRPSRLDDIAACVRRIVPAERVKGKRRSPSPGA